MVPNIGPTEIIIVLVVVLLIFGPKRLPGLGKSLGGGLREFKESITGGGSSRTEISDREDRASEPRDRAEPANRDAVTEEPEPVTAEPVGGGAGRGAGRDSAA